MNALANLHFLRPWALLALAALPLLWLLARRVGADAGGWRNAVDAHLLPHLIERDDGKTSHGARLLAALAWTLACIALAGPAWEREPMPLLRNESARVFALELAPSMLAQDLKPSRLERARFKLDDMLARSRDYQSALIGYAGEAFVAAPLTDDVGTVRHLVAALDPSTMPLAGNATDRAIDKAAALLEQAGTHHGQIILIADSAIGAARAAAKRARDKGYTVSVLGVGTTSGAPVALAQGDFLKDAGGNVVLARLDESALRELAAAGGGNYATLSAGSGDVDALLPDQAQVKAAKVATAEGLASGERWRDRGPWLLLLLLPLALIGFRRGWLMVLALAFIAPSPSAQAAGLSDLWQRRDQQAAAALARGDAKAAAQVAPDSAWRGGAAYREGDYARAADEYAQVDSADGAYNRGNALAQSGRYEDALAAYDQALEREPGMPDAVANRKIVEDALKKQQQQQNQQQQQKQQKQDQNQQQDQQGQQDQQNQQNQDGKQDQQDQQGKQNQDGKQDQQDQQGKQNQDGKQDQQSQQDQQDQQDKQGQQDKQSRQQSQQQESSDQQDAKASEQQRQALTQSVDQALSDKDKSQPAQPVKAPSAEDAATRERQQALEQWLQRVPDDPGGLLRRKFMLEYQRRQQGGGDGS